MAGRAGLIALGVTLMFVLWPFAMGMGDVGGDARTPPAGELLMAGLSCVLVFAVTFAISYAIQWRRRQAARRNR
jgi:hypothetical protein